MAAKTTAYILLEVYDSCRLWALSWDMIEVIRSLILRQVISNYGKATDEKVFSTRSRTHDSETYRNHGMLVI